MGRTFRPFDQIDQDQRLARASQQAEDYHITRIGERYLVEAPRGVYVTDARECSCADWIHRVSKCDGARCKHQCLVGNWCLARGIEFTAPALPTEDERVPCEECGTLLPAEEMAREIHEECGTVYICHGCDECEQQILDVMFDPFAGYVDPLADVPPPAGPDAFALARAAARASIFEED